MISEAVRRIYSLNEENRWGDGGETLTMGRDFTLR